uniref:bifunctional DNA-formamidopyrimidine glycosylase/DNA-(apurinic or apyrimidinic site) lyase n=1 Tax=Phocaeicola dorei TaxID=357276 RepID=UPI004028146A
MPEMPEVETIRRVIEPQIVGLKIDSVITNHSQVIAYPDMYLFEQETSGQIINRMSRRGKYLTIHFDSGDRLILHLRMTGQLLVIPHDYPMENHTHLIMNLSNRTQLRYIDVRRLGRFWLFGKNDIDDKSGLEKLGMEPLDDSLTASYLVAHLSKRKRPIKEMLHNQTVIAGIGNIYSDEILHAAGIYPGKYCSALSDKEWNSLVVKIREIIRNSIETNRMSPQEYLEGEGKEYRNMPDLRVYGQKGKRCKNCGSIIEKIVISGRSSCYCPHCQKKD